MYSDYFAYAVLDLFKRKGMTCLGREQLKHKERRPKHEKIRMVDTNLTYTTMFKAWIYNYDSSH